MRKHPTPEREAATTIVGFLLNVVYTLLLGTALWIFGRLLWMTATGQSFVPLPDSWRPFVIPIPFIVAWLLIDAPTRRLVFGARAKDDARDGDRREGL